MVAGFEQAQSEYEFHLTHPYDKGGALYVDEENTYKTFDDLKDDDLRKSSLLRAKEVYKNNTSEYVEYLEDYIVELLEWIDYLQHSKNEFIKLCEDWQKHCDEMHKQIKELSND